MKDLSEVAYILGIKIYKDRSRKLIGLSQSTYIDKVLNRFSMQDSKREFLPMSHGISHCTAVKNILKYLRRTKDAFLLYGGKEDELVINGYTDASF